MSFGPPPQWPVYNQSAGSTFGAPLAPSQAGYSPPPALVSAYDLAHRMKIKAREIGFDDPALSDKLYAEAKALEAGDALEVEDREF